VTPHTIPIPRVQDAFAEDSTLKDEKYVERIRKFFEELEWWVDAVRMKREKEKK
jgi:hypothetical protein